MSYQRELADVLLGYLGALGAADCPGIQITELALDVPIEVSGRMHRGQFVIVGSAPHSRWRSGFLAPVHNTSMTVVADEPSTQNPLNTRSTSVPGFRGFCGDRRV